MQKTFLFLVFAFLTVAVNAQTSGLRTKHFNIEKSVAIKGYDPVAYFIQNKAVKGNKNLAVSIDGVIYYCSSQTNKDLLVKTPSKYEPQYGGWCAYAMGAKGTKVEIDPETFKILDGKLYLFYNKGFTNTLPLWNKDESNLKTKADSNWKTTLSK
ncbi:MAG: YHS domain protein [Sphingobacteriales bacterium]|nr:YHS domain protein [Sphingobacteriales bacterium]MBP8192466.1 YHS domain protein [Chitinophagales bacterium]